MVRGAASGSTAASSRVGEARVESAGEDEPATVKPTADQGPTGAPAASTPVVGEPKSVGKPKGKGKAKKGDGKKKRGKRAAA